MKKSILLLSSVLAFASLSYAGGQVTLTAAPDQAPKKNLFQTPAKAPAYAEDSEELYMNVGYADGVYGGFTFDEKGVDVSTKDYIFLAFQLPVTDQKPYIGSSIAALNIVAGSSTSNKNMVSDVYLFVTDDISKPITLDMMTKGQLSSEAYGDNTINLKTPFEIKGEKPLYIGYAFKCPGANTYYLVTDGLKLSKNDQTCLAAVESAYHDITPKFANYADQVGSLCISAKVVGDKLPVNIGEMLAINVNPYNVFNDGKFNYQAYVRNMAANSIKNVTVKTEISNGAVTEATYDFETPVKPGEGGVVTLTDVANKAEGVYNLTSTLTKINGADVTEQTLNSTMASYSEGFQRNTVIEEATGVGCGFCPRGITSMDFLKKTYPELILIAVHCNWFGTDPMTVSQYAGLLSDFYSSNPQAFANRSVEVTLGGSSTKWYQALVDYYNSFPAYGDIEMTAELPEGKKVLNVNATAKFSTPSDVPHYLSFVIVEDGVGPYKQHNYYGNPGLGYGAFEGWENRPEFYEMMYDDVARAIKSYPGIRNSLPDVIEPNKDYEYSTTVSVTKVTGNDYRLIGLITNSVTGEIINAKQIALQKVGVEGVSAEEQNIDIQVVNGEIAVNGAQNVAIYTLDGRKVNATGLSNGVYIVTADGKSTKVLVK